MRASAISVARGSSDAASLNVLKRYYQLIKPGIIYGNSISVVAGFLLASPQSVDWQSLLLTLIGAALVIADGCILNNYLDRAIDTKMSRTKQRALVTGKIPAKQALVVATIFGLTGTVLLVFYVNPLTALIGLIGLYMYVVAYGIWKRRSPVGTPIGSIAGALPIVAGYTAASNRLDLAAGLLFVAMACWQMPHFYAIAMYRLRDYRAAGLPVLPAVSGLRHTKIQIMVYILAFTLSASLLTVFGYSGFVYLLGILLLGFIWLWKGYVGFAANDDATWAKRMFRFSLLVMLLFSILVATGNRLP